MVHEHAGRDRADAARDGADARNYRLGFVKLYVAADALLAVGFWVYPDVNHILAGAKVFLADTERPPHGDHDDVGFTHGLRQVFGLRVTDRHRSVFFKQ